MNRRELQVRWLAAVAILAAIAVPLILREQASLIHARMPENGGWSPSVLKAVVGAPLHLRLTSDDVVHGFAVGKVNMQSVDLLPGKVTDVTLTFAEPGTYTFYCTRWCGLNHWRMRGTIEVEGTPMAPAADSAPLYVSLGLNLDAPHPSAVGPPHTPISTVATRQLLEDLESFEDVLYYRAHSPSEAWQDIRSAPAASGLSDQDVWNLTASLWQANTSPAALEEGRRLYSGNCAACHGTQGDGRGVFADQLAASTAMTLSPADFADPATMLGASPALLQGKILRGGMGTGMPSWGPIFTDEQTWNLVSYLYTFQFTYR